MGASLAKRMGRRFETQFAYIVDSDFGAIGTEEVSCGTTKPHELASEEVQFAKQQDHVESEPSNFRLNRWGRRFSSSLARADGPVNSMIQAGEFCVDGSATTAMPLTSVGDAAPVCLSGPVLNSGASQRTRELHEQGEIGGGGEFAQSRRVQVEQ